jgi:hypothetical protein
MCGHINPELRTRMMQEMVEEIRKWFREWRRRNTVTGDLGLQRAGAGSIDERRTSA